MSVCVLLQGAASLSPSPAPEFHTLQVRQEGPKHRRLRPFHGSGGHRVGLQPTGSGSLQAVPCGFICTPILMTFTAVQTFGVRVCVSSSVYACVSKSVASQLIFGYQMALHW